MRWAFPGNLHQISWKSDPKHEEMYIQLVGDGWECALFFWGRRA